MMLEIAETSAAVMPAGMSATAMALGGGESSSEAQRRCSVACITKARDSHHRVDGRMVSVTNLSMFSYPIITSALSASSYENPEAGSS